MPPSPGLASPAPAALGPDPCARLPGRKALTVQPGRRAPNPQAEASRSTRLNLLLSRGRGGGWGCVEVPEIQCPSSTAPASVQTYGPWPRLAEGRQTPQTPAVSSPSWQRGRQ